MLGTGPKGSGLRAPEDGDPKMLAAKVSGLQGQVCRLELEKAILERAVEIAKNRPGRRPETVDEQGEDPADSGA